MTLSVADDQLGLVELLGVEAERADQKLATGGGVALQQVGEWWAAFTCAAWPRV
jgi:hypothetical protein